MPRLAPSQGSLRIVPTCDSVLEKCENYVEKLEVERKMLYDAVKEKDNRIVELESRGEGYPWWMYALTGVAAGIVGTTILK